MPFSIAYDLYIRTKKQKLSKIISYSQQRKHITNKKMSINRPQLQSMIQPPSLSIQINNFDFTKKSQYSVKISPKNKPVPQQISNENELKSLRKQSIDQNSCLKQSNINFGVNYMQFQKSQKSQSQSDQQQCHEQNQQVQHQINENNLIYQQKQHNFKISISGPLSGVENRLRSKAKSDDAINKLNHSQSQDLNSNFNLNNDKKLFYSDKANAKLKIEHFKEFFQFVLDFKLMKIQSYHPILHKVQIRKTLKDIKDQQMKKKIQHKLKESHSNHLAYSMNLQQHKNVKSIHKTNSSKLFESLQDSSNFKLSNSINIKNSINLSNQKQNPKKKQLQNSVVSLKVSNLQLQDESKSPLSGSQAQSHDSSLLCYHVPQKTNQSEKKNQFTNKLNINGKVNTNNLVQSENLSDRFSIQKTATKLVSYEELKLKIKNARAQTIHQGYYCNQCYVQPIVGNRYKCIECQDYDLCEKCYQNECWRYQKYERNPDSQVQIKWITNSQQSVNAFRNLRRSKSRMKKNILLKKQFSEIQQEEEQNDSSSLRSDIQEKCQEDKSSQHVHIMDIVLTSPLQNQLLKLSKVLRQTNTANQVRTSHISNSQKTIPFHENLQNYLQDQLPKGIIRSQKSLKKNYREDLNSIYQKIKKIKELKALSSTCKQTLNKK